MRLNNNESPIIAKEIMKITKRNQDKKGKIKILIQE